jgi:hypothetical protein
VTGDCPDRLQCPNVQRNEFGVPTVRGESQAVTATHREDLIRNNGLSITSEDLDRRPIDEDVQLHPPVLR